MPIHEIWGDSFAGRLFLSENYYCVCVHDSAMQAPQLFAFTLEVVIPFLCVLPKIKKHQLTIPSNKLFLQKYQAYLRAAVLAGEVVFCLKSSVVTLQMDKIR